MAPESRMLVKGDTPTLTRDNGIIMMARKQRLILELQQLAGKILRANELLPDFRRAARAGYTAFAGTRMNETELRRKVRCHMGAVDRGGSRPVANHS